MTTSADLIVDSHHHFWDLSKFDYYWMPPHPNVIVRNYLPEDLAPILKRNGISKTVLVQAHKSVDEANWLLDIAEANEFVAGVVAWVELTDPNVGGVLDALMKRPRLVGIRHQVEDDPDEAWLTRDASIRGLKEVADRGLAYDVLVKPQHLKYVPPLAGKVPNLRMVIDHIAKPLIAQGVIDPWASDIKAVADIPGVYCKISGMVTEADHANWIVDDLKPYVSHIVESFGFDRLMYGSDWPVCLLAADYDRMFKATLDAIGPMPDDDRAKFLGKNATEFYKL
jgi:L-fuconolactonase